MRLYGAAKIRVLVGCAPCQPYSGLNQKRPSALGMQPLERFAELITQVQPDVVSMENVRGLALEGKYPVFGQFLNTLRKQGYHVHHGVVNAADYGVPQDRHRLVLLASKLGPIGMTEPKIGKKPTVADAIGHLPVIRDGEQYKDDALHQSRKLSEINKSRIKATSHDGGDSRDWPENLKLSCHLKSSGKTFRNTVYGRMRWGRPAPTMTTQCVGLGNGRFGHPNQDRAISLREAALIQTFPSSYQFVRGRKYNTGDTARFIGNAVPIALAEAIGRSIKRHLQAHQ